MLEEDPMETYAGAEFGAEPRRAGALHGARAVLRLLLTAYREAIAMTRELARIRW
jgi:hypothetical protein